MVDPKTVQYEIAHTTSKLTMDCYAKPILEEAAKAWGREHFSFPWDVAAPNTHHDRTKNAPLALPEHDGAELQE